MFSHDSLVIQYQPKRIIHLDKLEPCREGEEYFDIFATTIEGLNHSTNNHNLLGFLRHHLLF